MLRVAASRALSTSARRDADLIQQAFVKKVKEYAQKGGDLVNTNPEVKKALSDELNRLAQKFQLANADVVAKIPTTFKSAKVESSVAAVLEGKTLAALAEGVKQEKSAYLAARAAKQAEEAKRAAALKGN